MYKESQGACQKVLEKEPNNVKALFRYGKVCTKIPLLYLQCSKLLGYVCTCRCLLFKGNSTLL